MTQHKDINMHSDMHVYYLERDFLLQKLKEEKAANTIFKGKVAQLTAQSLPSFVRYFMLFLSFYFVVQLLFHDDVTLFRVIATVITIVITVWSSRREKKIQEQLRRASLDVMFSSAKIISREAEIDRVIKKINLLKGEVTNARFHENG